MASDSKPKTVLMLGGNGLMGSETASQLIAENRYRITLANRGTCYFDVRERIHPHVQCVTCDRDGDLHELAEATNHAGRWDFVIDFSSYTGKQAEKVLAIVGDRIGHYIYISSDSVYEVSQPAAGRGASVESDAKRPDDPAERAKLNALDEYGHGKLEVEEVLMASGVPFTALRLPDVLGPRDTTRRWWAHQMWLQYLQEMGRPVPVHNDKRDLVTSYVYVKDVARVIRIVMSRAGDPEVTRRAFNISVGKDMNIKQLLEDMATELGVSGKVSEVTEDPEEPRFLTSVMYCLPSVSRGPINITLAREVLGFVPTPWETVLKETIEFYQQAFIRCPKERDIIAENLKAVAKDEAHVKMLDETIKRDIQKSQ